MRTQGISGTRRTGSGNAKSKNRCITVATSLNQSKGLRSSLSLKTLRGLEMGMTSSYMKRRLMENIRRRLECLILSRKGYSGSNLTKNQSLKILKILIMRIRLRARRRKRRILTLLARSEMMISMEESALETPKKEESIFY
jgi:hypothetical protein